jgi:plasmid stabilization system protein ParE
VIKVALNRYRVGPAAARDIDAIIEALQADYPLIAEKLNFEFEERFRRLLITGHSLRFRPEFGKNVRAVKFKSWMVFYNITDSTVLILRVLHGSAHPKRNQAKVSKT